MTSKKKYNLISIVLGVVILAIVIFVALNLFASPGEFDSTEPPGQEEIDAVLAAASRHLDLPNEEPTVGRISDADVLISQQGFYSGVENGDYLVIYPRSSKAILYSLERDILINVGPIQFQTETGEPAEFVLDNPISVEIRNGSSVSGAAGDLSRQLSKDFFEIANIGNAKDSEYSKTTIIVLDDEVPVEVLTSLADEIQASVDAELPDGEASSDAQILIIIGEDDGATSKADDTSSTEQA